MNNPSDDSPDKSLDTTTHLYTLQSLGWKPFFQQQLDSEKHLLPARVSRQDLNRYHLLSENGPLIGILPGRIRKEISSKAELPTVGDWVLVTPADDSDESQVVIQKTLDRASKFSRKEAGEKFDEQVVAANIDMVFIVTGLDENFNVARIERYLVLTWNSGALPVIVLNKTDICTDLDKKLSEVEEIARGTPIYPVSALTNRGLENLKNYIEPGCTAAVLGSSGVGKSTIINNILGFDHFKTGEVRQTDSKGRHTTTHRELCLLDNGGLVIDTPGMREIQIWADEDTMKATFEDVEAYIGQCKFTDCQHETEPGCALQRAIADGQLDAERLDSYQKFGQEMAEFNARFNAKLKSERKLERKKFTRGTKNRPTKRK